MEINGQNVILWYFGIVNLAAIIVYGWDKLCAKLHRWRVPEMTLLTIAAVGGSVGAMLAMQVFRHKTRHLKFKFGVPIIFILQIALIIALLKL